MTWRRRSRACPSPSTDQAIAAVLALRDRLDARIAEAVGEFDAVSLWDADGATSLVAWLRDRGGAPAGRRPMERPGPTPCDVAEDCRRVGGG
jgi:hypothetical protein